jgi:hypothetical protein
MEAAMSNRAAAVGTSPHGLPAELQVPVPETLDASSYHPSAKPLLTFSLTEEQREDLAFAAMCKAGELEEGDEADELEVREAIGNLWEAYKVLNGGRYE